MISDLYPCGFVVQSSEPGYLFTLLGINELRYCGLGRYLTWPLEHVQNDLVADGFWKEASRTWFNYTDERAWSVPDQDYIRRYVNYCESLGIKTRVLSLWSTFDFSMEFERDESKSIFLITAGNARYLVLPLFCKSAFRSSERNMPRIEFFI